MAEAMMRMRYGPASTEQVLGALPVVAGFCRRLDIAGIIDRAARCQRSAGQRSADQRSADQRSTD